MTYAAYETSDAQGQPIELFRFVRGPVSYRYTSAADEVEYNSERYEPVLIRRSALVTTDDPWKNEVTVSVRRNHLLAAEYLMRPLEEVIALSILRGHDTQFVTLWQGFVAQVTWDADLAHFRCEPRTVSWLRGALRRRYQRLCNYALYGPGCGVNADLYKETGTVASASGLTITASVFSGHASGYWTAGKIVYGAYRRLITSHTTNTVTISSAIPGIQTGGTFDVYPGCDHTPATCKAKFNNLVNFGGQPWIPTKNPFGGDPIM